MAILLGKKNKLAAIQRTTNRTSDSASIDKQNIIIGKGEFQVGEIFDLNEELKNLILNSNKNPIDLIEMLLEKEFIREKHFAQDIIEYIKIQSKDLENDTMLVLSGSEDNEAIHTIAGYKKDGNNETISRSRGGIINALINKRKKYLGRIHYIMPISNTEKTKARFYYKSFVGHTILQNMKNK